jgi:hypothetical protein
MGADISLAGPAKVWSVQLAWRIVGRVATNTINGAGEGAGSSLCSARWPFGLQPEAGFGRILRCCPGKVRHWSGKTRSRQAVGVSPWKPQALAGVLGVVRSFSGTTVTGMARPCRRDKPSPPLRRLGLNLQFDSAHANGRLQGWPMGRQRCGQVADTAEGQGCWP